MSRPRAVVAWSSGKDAAWALHRIRRRLEVIGLLTTVVQAADRVTMHEVPRPLLRRQAAAAGLPVGEVLLPRPCPNRVYEARMAEALGRWEVEHVVFGDLFLEDVRRYRERQLEGTGIVPVFPLWGADTRALAREMLVGGLRGVITCVDTRVLDPSFAGRTWDDALLADLPPGVDPCGERGEFHTFVTRGPMLRRPIEVVPGPPEQRGPFRCAPPRLAG